VLRPIVQVIVSFIEFLVFALASIASMKHMKILINSAVFMKESGKAEKVK
jgi:hypothetical protein